MKQHSPLYFSGKKVDCIFNGSILDALELTNNRKIVFITDHNIKKHHSELFSNHATYAIPAGEKYKNQTTVDNILDFLCELELDKDDFIIGVGGGVVSDITGYVSAIYKRGVRFGLLPSSILGMVDASIGGKNGINYLKVKNIIGTIYHPEFIVYDFSLLNTLPDAEWINGFAEIIKHACIKDSNLFNNLESLSVNDFKTNKESLSELIKRNVLLKTEVVKKDELDKADRKLLNFGHTFGHAIENIHELPHGSAVSIGMVIACKLSEMLSGFTSSETKRVKDLLEKYNLPVEFNFHPVKVMDMIRKDKKRNGENIDFVLLDTIGNARTLPVSLSFITDKLPYLLS